MSSSSSSLAALKTNWWLTSRKLAEKHLGNARLLLGSQEAADIFSAINLLDAALKLCPKWEKALELKARALLYVGRFKDVASMLEEHIPSMKFTESIPSESPPMSKENVKLLSSYVRDDKPTKAFLKDFLVSKLKKLLLTGLSKRCEREEWRYLVLGQACCHLGMMEDAMILLQSSKRAASAAFRQKSRCRNDDSFSSENWTSSESEIVSHLLGNIKLLLRRRAAAMAALDAGLYSESARHFSKILDGKRGTPQGFIAECYMYRAAAHHASGRVADAIADCNRTLALDPTCIEALTTRASLFETVKCLIENLQDLEHLKLLYESILRQRKLPGPAWKHRNTSFRDIQADLQYVNCKIDDLKQRLSSPYTVDYYTLLGLRKGCCTRADVEHAHLLLSLRHRPDKASHFVNRCEFVDDRDIDAVKDQARLSALMLYRLLQKAYTWIMASIMEAEAEKQKKLREDCEAQVKRMPEQMMLQGTNNASWKNLRGNYCSTESHICSSLSPDPHIAEFSSALEQACPLTNPVNDLTYMSITAGMPCNVQGEGSIISLSTESSEFSIYSSVTEDTIPPEFSDSGVFQVVKCRDLATVGSILSHAFPSDTWMNPHQAHSISPLQGQKSTGRWIQNQEAQEVRTLGCLCPPFSSLCSVCALALPTLSAFSPLPRLRAPCPLSVLCPPPAPFHSEPVPPAPPPPHSLPPSPLRSPVLAVFSIY
eukprot:Gb_13961 [translate_table: standard]